MPKVALITCRQLPEPDPDQQLMLDAIHDAGMDGQLLAWDDPSADVGAFDVAVLRSCWNYYHDPQAFLDWIALADTRTRLHNPASMVRWNIHKRYLRELQAAGVATIPSVWVSRGNPVDVTALMRTHNWHDIVIKPAISAASFLTQRFGMHQADEARQFLDAAIPHRDMMVQPFMRSVEQHGEQSLVCIAGQFTHAVCKRPRFADGHEQVSEAMGITPEQQAMANRVMAVVNQPLLYARVDVIRDDRDQLMVSELELIEPSLFFAQYPPALDRFVTTLKTLCDNPQRNPLCVYASQ